MKVSFGFGKSEVNINIPDQNLKGILRANPIEKTQKDEQQLVKDALEAPIGTPRLKEIVHRGEKIAVITSDITRPMPSWKVLPNVLDELKEAGIPSSDITIVFALGSHRVMTDEEKKKLAGESVFESYKCLDSAGEMVHLGETANGTPVDIFKPVAEADRRICLGNIEYHYFAGYSGGAKAIMPGCSTREAIQANHSRMVDHHAEAGRLAGNPVREDIEAAAAFAPIDFIVNVVLDEHKNICACFAGHSILAHRAGCRFLDKMYSIKIADRTDIVIVSPGGYPKDLNLYQAQKALDNAGHAIRNGGTILWIASAKEGLGEKHFEQWMTGHDRPEDMIEHIQREFVLGGHKAAAIAMIMARAKIILYSDLEPDFVRSIHLTPASDPQQELDELLKIYGPEASVLAMPFGGATLPVIEKGA